MFYLTIQFGPSCGYDQENSESFHLKYTNTEEKRSIKRYYSIICPKPPTEKPSTFWKSSLPADFNNGPVTSMWGQFEGCHVVISSWLYCKPQTLPHSTLSLFGHQCPCSVTLGERKGQQIIITTYRYTTTQNWKHYVRKHLYTQMVFYLINGNLLDMFFHFLSVDKLPTIGGDKVTSRISGRTTAKMYKSIYLHLHSKIASENYGVTYLLSIIQYCRENKICRASQPVETDAILDAVLRCLNIYHCTIVSYNAHKVFHLHFG